jgi:pantoate--beta-alanine ligase
MVRDLDMDVEIVVCPIVREADGLAMSSRNAYLNGEQRKQALVLRRSLQQVKTAVEAGEQDARKLVEMGTQVINAEPGARLDYFAIVDADTLEPVSSVTRGTLIAVAAWVGATRLIDNRVL